MNLEALLLIYSS